MESFCQLIQIVIHACHVILLLPGGDDWGVVERPVEVDELVNVEHEQREAAGRVADPGEGHLERQQKIDVHQKKPAHHHVQLVHEAVHQIGKGHAEHLATKIISSQKRYTVRNFGTKVISVLVSYFLYIFC